jgi:hypothetical protein
VVLAVVEVDGLSGHVRLEGGAVVRKGGELDGHFFLCVLARRNRKKMARKEPKKERERGRERHRE